MAGVDPAVGDADAPLPHRAAPGVAAGQGGEVAAEPQFEVIVVQPARGAGREFVVTHGHQQVARRQQQHAHLGAVGARRTEDEVAALAALVDHGRARAQMHRAGPGRLGRPGQHRHQHVLARRAGRVAADFRIVFRLAVAALRPPRLLARQPLPIPPRGGEAGGAIVVGARGLGQHLQRRELDRARLVPAPGRAARLRVVEPVGADPDIVFPHAGGAIAIVAQLQHLGGLRDAGDADPEFAAEGAALAAILVGGLDAEIEFHDRQRTARGILARRPGRDQRARLAVAAQRRDPGRRLGGRRRGECGEGEKRQHAQRVSRHRGRLLQARNFSIRSIALSIVSSRLQNENRMKWRGASRW